MKSQCIVIKNFSNLIQYVKTFQSLIKYINSSLKGYLFIPTHVNLPDPQL